MVTAAALCGVACNQPQKDEEQSAYKAVKNAKPSPMGSEPPREISLPPQKEESNIIGVNKFFDSFPWLNFGGDAADTINGFKCALYLTSSHSGGKGVFGTGTIVVTMYRLDSDRRGREVATEVFSWTLPREDAFAFRGREPTMMGWGYGLRLGWDDKVDVAGRKIALLFRYVRDDGRIVSATRQVLKVPLTGMNAVPASSEVTPPPPRQANRRQPVETRTRGQ